MSNYGYIYKITNIKTNKLYIGQTSVSIDFRYKSHIYSARRSLRDKTYVPQIIDRSIAKHGKENFVVEEIECCLLEDLNSREIYWIAFFDATNPRIGYNISKGGHSSISHTEETREKIRKSSSGRIWITNGSEQHFIRPELLDDFIYEGSEWRRQRLPASFLDPETRSKKISDKLSGKVSYTDGVIEVHISEDDIAEYESLGFKPGRIIDGKTIYSHIITNGKSDRKVSENVLCDYLKRGWILGSKNFLTKDLCISVFNNYKDTLYNIYVNNARKANKANTGKTKSEDTKKKISETLKEYNKTEAGISNRARISKLRKGKPCTRHGFKMPRDIVEYLAALKRGKIFVNNSDKDILIDPSDLDYYKSLGYIEGRLIGSGSETFWMTDGNKNYRVKLSDIEKKSLEGFYFGRCNTKKQVYCVDRSSQLVKQFQSVKEAANWWFENGYDTVKDPKDIYNRIRLSAKEELYIKDLKWSYGRFSR